MGSITINETTINIPFGWLADRIDGDENYCVFRADCDLDYCILVGPHPDGASAMIIHDHDGEPHSSNRMWTGADCVEVACGYAADLD
jgi:hypothetical protein